MWHPGVWRKAISGWREEFWASGSRGLGTRDLGFRLRVYTVFKGL